MTSTSRSRGRSIGPIMGRTNVEYWSPHFINASTYTPTLYFKEESIDDFVTENYHTRSARGEIFNNPVVYTVDSQLITGSTTIDTRRVISTEPTVYGTDNYRWWGEGVLQATRQESGYSDIFDHLPTTVDSSIEISRAKQFALAKIDTTPYDFAEDSFEVRETLRFLKNPVRGLRDLSREFKKVATGRSKGLNTLAKRISDAWLEYRFAFSPLVRTIDEAVDYFHDSGIERPKRRTARGGGSDKNEIRTDLRINVLGFPGDYHIYDTHTVHTLNVRSGVLYEVSNPINDWRFQTGLRNKDIPATIWDLLPYSFMVDRVGNISNGIRGLTNLLDPNVTILAAWYSLKDEQLTKVKLVDKFTSSFEVKLSGDQEAVRKTFTYSRTVWEPIVSDTAPTIHIGGLVKDAKSIADFLAIVVTNVT